MSEAAAAAADQVCAPSITPDDHVIDHVIDFAHLARMTFDDRKLERELLALFDRQAEMLAARMRDAAPDLAASHAHTLKGSACGIGAWRVASAAEALERAGTSDEHDRVAMLDRLDGAVSEARFAIAAHLREP